MSMTSTQINQCLYPTDASDRPDDGVSFKLRLEIIVEADKEDIITIFSLAEAKLHFQHRIKPSNTVAESPTTTPEDP